MTDETTKDELEPGVLAQAYPQLGSSSLSGAVSEEQELAQALPTRPMELVKTAPRELVPVRTQRSDLGMLSDIPVLLVFEVGQQKISLPQLMDLSRGSVIPLSHVNVDTVYVKVSDTIIAKAETINLKQRYGVRLSELIIPTDLETD